MSVKHLALHGTSAIADNVPPNNVVISYTPSGALVTPPPGSGPNYLGNVYFLFQSPPMNPVGSFDISGLRTIVNLQLSSIQQVEMYSGSALKVSVSHPPIAPDSTLQVLSANNLVEATLAPDAGLCVAYTIKFNNENVSSAFFSTVDLEYVE